MMGCCLFVHHRKKRKQEGRDVDSLSLCSLDINEPNTKRSKPLSRVTSLASLLPPVKTTPLKRIGQTLQRSISFRSESRTEIVKSSRPWPHPPSSAGTRPPANGPRPPATASATKRRDSKLWSETFDVRLGATQPLSAREIKRQEAIFELSQGEQDLVEDLRLAKKAYHDPMLKLSIMTGQELNQIFGTLDSLIPLHEDLLSRLREARKADGSTEHVGHILVDWLPCLDRYTSYCSNQVAAKALLDQKKQDRRVQDFLQRCLESPFSRKLDLWNFLDIPRSRLVKYPLLLKEILKHTPNDHPDRQHLEEAIIMVQSIVADINRQTGESECLYYKQRLVYSEEGRRDSLIDRSRTLSCRGELKNNRGLKLHVFLFQDVLVITRCLSISDQQQISYQLCRQPIPIRHLELEDLPDGEMRVGGSIRGAFSNNERSKNFFRVSHRGGGPLQTHCFQASDTFNKQQWLNCIRQAQGAALAGDAGVERGPGLGGGGGGETGVERGPGLGGGGGGGTGVERDVGGGGGGTGTEPGLSGGVETEVERRPVPGLGEGGETEFRAGGGRQCLNGEMESGLGGGVGQCLGGGVGECLDGGVGECLSGEMEGGLGGCVGECLNGEMEGGLGGGVGECLNGEMEGGLGGGVGECLDGEMEGGLGGGVGECLNGEMEGGLDGGLGGGSGALHDDIGVDLGTSSEPNHPQNPPNTTGGGGGGGGVVLTALPSPSPCEEEVMEQSNTEEEEGNMDIGDHASTAGEEPTRRC